MRHLEKPARSVSSPVRKTSIVAPKPPRMEVQVRMDCFEHPYYRLNKAFMTIIGQWPYQSTRTKCVFLAAVIFVCASQMMSRIRTIVNNRDDSDIVIACATPLLIEFGFVTYMIGFTWNSQKVSFIFSKNDDSTTIGDQRAPIDRSPQMIADLFDTRRHFSC